MLALSDSAQRLGSSLSIIGYESRASWRHDCEVQHDGDLCDFNVPATKVGVQRARLELATFCPVAVANGTQQWDVVRSMLVAIENAVGDAYFRFIGRPRRR